MKALPKMIIGFMALSLPILATAQAAPVETPEGEPKLPKQKFMRYGISGTTFLPSDRRTQEAFGRSWGFTVPTGILPLPFLSPIATAEDTNRGAAIGFNIQTIFNRPDDANRTFLVSFDLEYRQRFDDQFEQVGDQLKLKQFVPYAGFALSPMYSDISAKSYGVQSKQLGFGASVFAGATISNRWELSARYLYAPAIQGFNMNGLSLSLSAHF